LTSSLASISLGFLTHVQKYHCYYIYLYILSFLITLQSLLFSFPLANLSGLYSDLLACLIFDRIIHWTNWLIFLLSIFPNVKDDTFISAFFSFLFLSLYLSSLWKSFCYYFNFLVINFIWLLMWSFVLFYVVCWNMQANTKRSITWKLNNLKY